jgi:predicted AlkP superfamily pyrophosphatase or phosphodiesterase
LVNAPKIWDVLRKEQPGFTCAKLFWWYNMYSTADYTITPRPMYPADGRKVFDIYTHPANIREDLKKDLGEFPFPAFWGPAAGVSGKFEADQVSRWIAESAKWIERQYAPTLSLIYLPHLDYNLQRLGPTHPDVRQDYACVDTIAGDLIMYFETRGITPLIISEYGITPVNNPIHLNRLFRQKGWIAIREELGLELLDPGASRAFAVADHQIAHIYVNDSSIVNDVRSLLERISGVEKILGLAEKREAGLDHPRAGDLIAITGENSWFTYYYWFDDSRAPDFARTVDIHRKPGYDPVELFLDPTIRAAMAKIALKLLRKKLGFRMLMDVIPLDATLVKGSHGRVPTDKKEWPILVAPDNFAPGEIRSTDVLNLLRASVMTNS